MSHINRTRFLYFQDKSGIDSHRIGFGVAGEERVQVERFDLREIAGKLRQAQYRFFERIQIGGFRAAETGQQFESLDAANLGVGVIVG